MLALCLAAVALCLFALNFFLPVPEPERGALCS